MQPGFYSTNPRALTVRELLRSNGLLRLPLLLAASRFMKPLPGGWMPSLWADNRCEREQLSSRFWEATAAQRSRLEQLGFAEVALSKPRRDLTLVPSARDGGAITYLDQNRAHIGMLTYNRVQKLRAPYACLERVGCSFTAVFPGGSVSCSNRREAFDPAPSHRVFRIKSADPVVVHDRFLAVLRQRQEPPVVFQDFEALRRWSDGLQREQLEHWVARGLFVRMTDDEVAAARKKIPPPLPWERQSRGTQG